MIKRMKRFFLFILPRMIIKNIVLNGISYLPFKPLRIFGIRECKINTIKNNGKI